MGRFWFFGLIGMAHAYLVWHRLIAYLRYFQQEGYEALRFAGWAKLRSLTDPALWLSLVSMLVCARSAPAAAALFAAGVLLFVRLQPDPRRSGKVPLRLTWRATRVLVVAAIWGTALWIWFVLAAASDLQAPFLASAIAFACVPLMLIAADWTLTPYERWVQNAYQAEAIQRVSEVQPFIIGITGSYGKSSAKAMLAHILQFHAPTLAASGSINTLMGVTRHIREELVLGHRFMVVEMGAFKTGSIRRLCQLTPPSAASSPPSATCTSSASARPTRSCRPRASLPRRCRAEACSSSTPTAPAR